MAKACAKFGAIVLVSGSVFGCLFGSVKDLDPEAKNVKVVRESTKPLHCKSLGDISGKSSSDDEKAARTGAENDFRNNAARLNANFALIEAERSNRAGTSSVREVFIGGQALECKTPEMEEGEEAARQKALEEKDAREAQEKEEAERKAAEEKEKADAEKAAKADTKKKK
jgi:translation initiation factor 4G